MPSKEKLSRDVLDARLRIIHAKSPKAGQLLAIETLFNEEKDVILISPLVAIAIDDVLPRTALPLDRTRGTE